MLLVLAMLLGGAWWLRSPDPRGDLEALSDPTTYSDLRDRATDLLNDVLARQDVFDVPKPVAIPDPRSLGPRGSPPPGVDEEPTRLLPAVTVGEANPAFGFASLQDDGETPIAWSPCRPIRYVVNPAGAPEGFVDAVRDVAAEVSAATGLVLTYDGTTAEGATAERAPYQEAAYGERWAPVLVAATDAAALPYLDGDVAGVAYTYRVANGGGGPWFLVSGAVYLDAEAFDFPSRDGEEPWVAVLRHEMGHLVGLDHVDDPSQLMNPVTSTVRTFQAGDLTGLSILGQGECAPDV